MQVAIVCPLFIPSENNVALILEAFLKTCPAVNEKFSKSKRTRSGVCNAHSESTSAILVSKGGLRASSMFFIFALHSFFKKFIRLSLGFPSFKRFSMQPFCSFYCILKARLQNFKKTMFDYLHSYFWFRG
mgnify:CR=1 FL=1